MTAAIRKATRQVKRIPLWAWLITLTLASALVCGLTFYFTSQTSSTVNQAQSLADRVINLCKSSDPQARSALVKAGACQKAASVSDQIKQPIAVPGLGNAPSTPSNNSDGGRGISGTSVEGGHLYIQYTNGQREDKGSVQGNPGTPGAQGKKGSDGTNGANGTNGGPGKNAPVITGAPLSADGTLTLQYSDGHSDVVGRIVGPAGRGIASVAAKDGRLIVTFTDGDTFDVGPLPQGQQGAQGPQGVQGQQGPQGQPGADGQPGKDAPTTDGYTQRNADGRTQNCTKDSGSSETHPSYTCTYTDGEPATPAPAPTTSNTPPTQVLRK